MLENLKETVLVRAWAFAKVPLLFLARPRVVSLNDHEVVIALPFSKLNKNHLGSLYFGALCIGADAAGGLIAMRALEKVKRGKGSLIFKDFKAEFLKRAEGETFFTCSDGPEIHAAVKQTEESLERTELPVHVIATVPSKFGNEPVAKFVLTLSLKVRR